MTLTLVTAFATLVFAITFYVSLSDEQSNLSRTIRNLAASDKRTTAAQISATRALCNIRDAYDHQIASSYAFLRQHPHGIDGITPLLIRQGITDTKTRRNALADVVCPKVQQQVHPIGAQ